MKKVTLIIIACLILGAVSGYFAWRSLAKSVKTTSGSESPTPSGGATTKGTSEKMAFMWGVNVNPSAVRKYNIETWNTELLFTRTLGAKWIRLSFDNAPSNKFAIFDEMIGAAKASELNVYLGLGSTKPILSISDTYKDGYQVGSEVASHYKGKIQYYQLMSEQGSTALKGPNFAGENESDYDKTKYNKVKDWMKGASEAIRKADPSAKLVITEQWTHTAYLDMLKRDNIDYDIIGWNWFGDMGLMGDRKLKDGTKLIDKLNSFGKPVILSEINYRPGKNGMDEQKQSDFITKMADWAYNSGKIKGFIVHELFDLAPRDGKNADYYGLVKFEKSPDGGYKFGDTKLAFNTYKNIIAKYSK